VSRAATVEGSERLRLFCALRLPEETVDGIVAWQVRALAEVPGTRVVARENLHATLAFLGHRPESELEAIVGALRGAAEAAEPARLSLHGYRETRSVGMLTFDDEDGRAAALARDLHERLAALGAYEPERRRWLPHVTVLRFRERPRLKPELPALEPFAPSDAAAYLSRLRPGGAQYEVLESVALGGR
jgi:RNA 2',3'-cyclic 3'-phosphodiesterase